MTPKRTPLSHSRLERATCLFLFNRAVLQKDPEAKGEPAMKGGFFHEVASRFLKYMQTFEGQVSDRQAAMEGIFEEAWHATRPGEFIGLDEGNYDDLKALALRWAREEPFGPSFQGSEVKLAVNDRWERVDWMAPDVYYRMIIDRLDVVGGRVIITDYKTSWRADSQDEVERSPQFRGYAAGINAVLPEATEIEVRADFVRPRIVRSAIVHPDQIEAARARVHRESERIERAKKTDNFPANPGAYCAYCPVFVSCPLRGAAQEFRAPETDQAAKDLLAGWALQKRVMDELTGRLRAWVEQHGPVETAGLLAEFARVEVIEYPGGPALALLRELAYEDVGDYLKGDRRRLEKAAKVSERLAAGLDAIRVVKPQSRWKCGKGEDEEVF